ncbi:unnamed protein product, partial [Mesorhabditis spiculigera]
MILGLLLFGGVTLAQLLPPKYSSDDLIDLPDSIELHRDRLSKQNPKTLHNLPTSERNRHTRPGGLELMNGQKHHVGSDESGSEEFAPRHSGHQGASRNHRLDVLISVFGVGGGASTEELDYGNDPLLERLQGRPWGQPKKGGRRPQVQHHDTAHETNFEDQRLESEPEHTQQRPRQHGTGTFHPHPAMGPVGRGRRRPLGPVGGSSKMVEMGPHFSDFSPPILVPDHPEVDPAPWPMEPQRRQILRTPANDDDLSLQIGEKRMPAKHNAPGLETIVSSEEFPEIPRAKRQVSDEPDEGEEEDDTQEVLERSNKLSPLRVPLHRGPIQTVKPPFQPIPTIWFPTAQKHDEHKLPLIGQNQLPNAKSSPKPATTTQYPPVHVQLKPGQQIEMVDEPLSISLDDVKKPHHPQGKPNHKPIPRDFQMTNRSSSSGAPGETLGAVRPSAECVDGSDKSGSVLIAFSAKVPSTGTSLAAPTSATRTPPIGGLNGCCTGFRPMMVEEEEPFRNPKSHLEIEIEIEIRRRKHQVLRCVAINQTEHQEYEGKQHKVGLQKRPTGWESHSHESSSSEEERGHRQPQKHHDHGVTLIARRPHPRPKPTSEPAPIRWRPVHGQGKPGVHEAVDEPISISLPEKYERHHHVPPMRHTNPNIDNAVRKGGKGYKKSRKQLQNLFKVSGMPLTKIDEVLRIEVPKTLTLEREIHEVHGSGRTLLGIQKQNLKLHNNHNNHPDEPEEFEVYGDSQNLINRNYKMGPVGGAEFDDHPIYEQQKERKRQSQRVSLEDFEIEQHDNEDCDEQDDFDTTADDSIELLKGAGPNYQRPVRPGRPPMRDYYDDFGQPDVPLTRTSGQNRQPRSSNFQPDYDDTDDRNFEGKLCANARHSVSGC